MALNQNIKKYGSTQITTEPKFVMSGPLKSAAHHNVGHCAWSFHTLLTFQILSHKHFQQLHMVDVTNQH